ncbi:MAG: HAD family phosphatase [Candidatus Izemoplasma sp.]|nr:HAD family phosphatase [Candidatus Izemoplasma sp.]
MITTILFDMDGVITNTEKYHFESWQEAFKLADIDITKNNYHEHVQARNHQQAISAVIGSNDKKIIELISQTKRQVYKERINKHVDVYQDTMNFIKDVKQSKLKLAVVSASSMAKEVLDKAGLLGYFDLVIEGTKDNNLRNKPYPDLYLHAMALLESQPEETLIIEDSLSGIKAGIKSGASVIGVERDKLDDFEHKRCTVVPKITTDLVGELI